MRVARSGRSPAAAATAAPGCGWSVDETIPRSVVGVPTSVCVIDQSRSSGWPPRLPAPLRADVRDEPMPPGPTHGRVTACGPAGRGAPPATAVVAGAGQLLVSLR